MAIQREHILQKHARLWAREALACEHLFLAFDRSKAASRFSHLHQKNMGITAGTPDTLLMVKFQTSHHNIWCELKSPGNTPSEIQMNIGERLRRLGSIWFWCTSVDEYRLMLCGCFVPMHPNASFLALHHDGLVASEIAKAEAKKGVVPKRRKATHNTNPKVALESLRRRGVLV